MMQAFHVVTNLLRVYPKWRRLSNLWTEGNPRQKTAVRAKVSLIIFHDANMLYICFVVVTYLKCKFWPYETSMFHGEWF